MTKLCQFSGLLREVQAEEEEVPAGVCLDHSPTVKKEPTPLSLEISLHFQANFAGSGQFLIRRLWWAPVSHPLAFARTTACTSGLYREPSTLSGRWRCERVRRRPLRSDCRKERLH